MRHHSPQVTHPRFFPCMDKGRKKRSSVDFGEVEWLSLHGITSFELFHEARRVDRSAIETFHIMSGRLFLNA